MPRLYHKNVSSEHEAKMVSFSPMPDRDKIVAEDDKCQRWRKIAIDQLGYVLNLTLTFTVAALGYLFVLLEKKDFVPEASAKCFTKLSLLVLALSAICGYVCALNRLWDFRGTARRACDHPMAPTKDELRDLGTRTWCLFYLQLALFGMGLVFLAVVLLLTYGSKLS